jgi:hypothetical protein
MKALHNVQSLEMCIATAQVWLLYEKEKCHWSVFCFLLFFFSFGFYHDFWQFVFLHILGAKL